MTQALDSVRMESGASSADRGMRTMGLGVPVSGSFSAVAMALESLGLDVHEHSRLMLCKVAVSLCISA